MRVALVGDTMLGRGVAERLGEVPAAALFSDEVVEAMRAADLRLANLECCISERGRPTPGRVFHFRAPPSAVEALRHLEIDCVTLANNHALDYGPVALLDTLEHLRGAGIEWVGAGPDEASARASAVLEAGEERLRVVGVSDHPAEYAAGPAPGIAFADLTAKGLPGWLADAIAGPGEPEAASRSSRSEAVLISPHWGPNMTTAPLPHVRRAARALADAGAALVAGHSAHVFHGACGRFLYDLGDFIDDYRLDPVLRNDLGLLWFVELDRGTPVGVEALPLKLDCCHTRLARGEDAAWIARRLVEACRDLGAEAREEAGRIVVGGATRPNPEG